MAKQEIVSEVTEELLEKLGVVGSVTVGEEEEAIRVTIETEEAGILIGYHGETLRSLELVLTLLASARVGDFTRIILDVAGYQKQREEKILELASKIKEQVKSEGQPLTLPNLTPRERRLVHLFFQNDKEVTTESQGEGETRQLVIKPR